ncbi:MFS transporter [Providencia burhodogranariea]|uniref:Major facilitator superfamily MFS_1 n=1 Tax=Providencia burhodogranariea DSM 19968 TaxID=1141662 RepID=K8WWV0_9GAMM|nr:MFS transporter [Providencia burhodogranariea]EKT60695.1 major facilitator superfamily MFS_1 [Providencia burhodogranariea DSM 19968]
MYPETKDIERSTIRKISIRLIPLMVMLYVIAYIDRQNIGFAKLHMADSLGLSETAFGLGASLFFIGYLLFEVPSNIFLHKVGARVWFARIMFTWGLITVLMAFTTNTTVFYLLRFLLGAAEAGLYPGLLYYMTKWFPLSYRPKVVGYLIIASLSANLIGAPLNGMLLSIHGHLGFEGWQWIFIGTGLPALIFIIPVLLLLPDSKEKANFLSPEQKNWLDNALSKEQAQYQDQDVSGVLNALKDKRVLLLALVLGFISFGAYGLSYWMPTIVKGFGVSDMTNGFINMIPWLVTIVWLIWMTRKAERTADPVKNIALPMFIAAIFLAGSALFISIPWLSFLCITFVIMAIFSIQPCFWTLTRFLGNTAAAAGLAAINSLANLGGFFAQNTVPAIRDLTGSTSAPMYYLGGCMLIGGFVTLLVIKYLHKYESIGYSPELKKPCSSTD